MTQILFLEMGEEVFGRSIIPTITTTRHGGGDVRLLDQKIMVDRRSVLKPLITMQDQPIGDLLMFLGLLDGLQDESHIIASMQNMSDDETIEQDFDDGQVGTAVL